MIKEQSLIFFVVYRSPDCQSSNSSSEFQISLDDPMMTWVRGVGLEGSYFNEIKSPIWTFLYSKVFSEVEDLRFFQF